MRNLCDVHIIHHPEKGYPVYKSELVNVLFDELGINVIDVPGIAGDIAQGRLQGFTSGQGKYVSFVDDDDSVKLPVFNRCIEELDADKTLDGVCTLEQVKKNGKTFYTSKLTGDIIQPHNLYLMHHIVMVRRTSLMRYVEVLNKAKGYPEFTLWATMLLADCKFKQIKEVGYQWNNNHRAQRLNLPITDYTRTTINRCVRFNGKMLADGLNLEF